MTDVCHLISLSTVFTRQAKTSLNHHKTAINLQKHLNRMVTAGCSHTVKAHKPASRLMASLTIADKPFARAGMLFVFTIYHSPKRVVKSRKAVLCH